MRIVALVLLGTLVACAGEIAPEDSGKTAAPQRADTNDDGDVLVEPTTEATPTYSDERCWDYGAPAAGECEIGERPWCDGYQAFEGIYESGTYCLAICVNDGGKAVWKKTYEKTSCPFFDSPWHKDIPGCSCADYEAKRAQDRANEPPQSTPLVLSFDDAPVVFTATAGGAFDLAADGQCHGSDWPSAATPWLALDRDGNGSIDDGGELFGSAVRLANGARAKNGFEALRELDTNHDRVFDANDEAFAKVVVWTDKNGDRRSTPNELQPLAEVVTFIALNDDASHRRCDTRGNCEGERSIFTTAAGKRGTVIDVYLKMR